MEFLALTVLQSQASSKLTIVKWENVSGLGDIYWIPVSAFPVAIS